MGGLMVSFAQCFVMKILTFQDQVWKSLHCMCVDYQENGTLIEQCQTVQVSRNVIILSMLFELLGCQTGRYKSVLLITFRIANQRRFFLYV